MKALVISAPASLRSELEALSTSQLVVTCSRFRSDPDRLDDPIQGIQTALRSIARRGDELTTEARQLELQLDGRPTGTHLHRGGDRSANHTLHIAAIVRMRYCPKTRAYAAKRTSEGLSKPELIRRIKRYLAREVFIVLRADILAMSP